jgi:hypothetical protein
LLTGNGSDVSRTRKTTENKNNMDQKKAEQLAQKLKDVMQKGAPQPHFWSWENVKERVKKLRV